MNTPKTSDDVMREMNDLARKLGRYPTRQSWAIQPQPGSILDVPLTVEEEARLHRLDALIARLERENAAVTEEQQDGRRVQDGTLPTSVGAASIPPATAAES